MNYIVYVKSDANGYITAVESSGFLSDATGWVEIDRGSGDRFYLAQGNYFPKSLYTDSGVCRYKLVNGKPVECTPVEIAEQEEANKPVPVEPERSVWDELDAAYQEGVDSV
ncbi:MAG: hypothetical protein J6V25_02315 [Oscillospiraceae bacterium]|nr:hypothetical protein [Oscillospiraceae bacterium]